MAASDTDTDTADIGDESEEDPVVLVTGGIVPQGECYHTDPDCPSLTQASNVIEIRQSELEERKWEFEKCTNCSQVRPDDADQDKSYFSRLMEARQRYAEREQEGNDGE